MANVTVTEAADFIPELWAATALGALKANSVMARLVNRDFEPTVQTMGDILHIPKRGTLTVHDKSANTGVTLQTPQSDKVDLTLNKHKEVSFIVEDIAKAQANQDIIAGYVTDGMIAIANQIDADLLALYSGFSTTPIDGTGGSGGIQATTVTEARRLLNKAKAPQDNRYIVWHEDAEAELFDVEKFTSTFFGDPGDAVVNAVIGRKFGFAHFMDQNVVESSGEAKNLAFHRDAMVLATRPLGSPPANTGVQSSVMVEDGIGIRVLFGYNMTYLGLQVTLDILYGVAELRDAFGVTVRSTLVA